MNFTFAVTKREEKIKDPALAMGVAYGPKHESTAIKFDRKAFTKLLQTAGTTNIITLEGLAEPVEVTIRNVDRAPFTNEVHHVEFYVLERGVEMSADVPLVQVNEPGVNSQEGIVNQIAQTLNINCRPRDLIQEIELDMSLLKSVGDTITVADLNVPEGITINHDPDMALVSVSAVTEEPKDETEEVPDAAEVPVVGAEDSSSEEEESA